MNNKLSIEDKVIITHALRDFIEVMYFDKELVLKIKKIIKKLNYGKRTSNKPS